MSATEKPRVIAVMAHGPPYHFDPDATPEFSWKKSDGSMVGFWAREWLDYIGEEILKETGRYEWEVWQPDYRADKVYSQTLDTGVIHRLFPAEDQPRKTGIRTQSAIVSEAMISRLKEIEDRPIILLIFGLYGFRLPFYLSFLNAFGPAKRIPIFMLGGGTFRTPLGELPGLHWPLTYLSLIIEHFQVKKALGYADVISELSLADLKKVGTIYGGRIEAMTFGCDFKFWIPPPVKKAKQAARRKLNISAGKTVFFASAIFLARKQLDKLLEVFTTLKNRDDFCLIIAGQGDEEYTKRLTALAAPLAKEGKAIMHPYVLGEDLRDIYWASDLFVSVSSIEGGPVTVMKAMACGLPVITTPVGHTADTMKKHAVGRLVPVNDYNEWARAFLEVLDGRMPKPLDMQTARETYDWPHVARWFIGVFDDLLAAYHPTEHHDA
ncbi:MAG: glycosyltransferase family 4 protein [Elusimicrobiota bacterium]